MSTFTKVLPLAAVISASTTMAGGFDNSGQPFGIILGSGSQVSMKTVMTSASIEGTANSKATDPFNANSVDVEIDDLYNDPVSMEIGARVSINDSVRCAIQIDEPYKTNTGIADDSLNYFDPTAPSPGPLLNAEANSEDTPIDTKINSNAVTLGCGYSVEFGKSRLTVFGGPKIEKIDAFFSADMMHAASPIVAGSLTPPIALTASGDSDNIAYDMSTDYDLGYVVGIGYEIEEYAVKIGLTYHAAIEHKFEGTVTGGTDLQSLGRSETDTVSTTIDTPAAVNLSLQTGVMPNWLVFADLRYAKWGDLNNLPVTSATGGYDVELGLFSSDTLDYRVGVGHQLTESAVIVASYSGSTKLDDEDLPSGVDGDSLRQPTGDTHTFGLGGRLTLNSNMALSGGIGYTIVKEFTIDNGSFVVDFDSTHATTFVAGLDINL